MPEHPLERYYPELVRNAQAIFGSGERSDVIGALITEPRERRHAQETLAQFAQDVVGQDSSHYAAVLVHAFMLGVWLAQIGFAKVPTGPPGTPKA